MSLDGAHLELITDFPPEVPAFPAASRARVERAVRFRSEIEAELQRYVAANPSRYELEVMPDHSVQLRVTKNSEGLGPGLIFGDCVHSLRAALDLLASDLARLAGYLGEDVYFPFAKSAELLPAAIKSKNFHRCGADAVQVLKTVAPFAGPGGNGLLRALHDLDIRDKHRALVLGRSTYRVETQLQYLDVPGTKIEYFAAPDVHAFAMPAEGPLAGKDVLETLDEFILLVGGIIDSFVKMHAARPAAKSPS